jgi:hypothetical protein
MAEYEDFLAHGDVARFVAVYDGRHDALDALWWLSHPLEPAPSGADAPASARAALQAAAYSREGGAEAQLALARLERELADDRIATLAALAVAQAPLPEPERPTAGSAATDRDEVPVSDRSRRRRTWAGLAVGVAVVLVVGAIVAVRPVLAPAAKDSATPTSVSSLSITGDGSSDATLTDLPVYSGTASCYNLLDVDTLNFFGMQAYQEVSAESESNDAADQNSPLYPFIEAGGLVCAWKGPSPVNYAYAPISADEAANEQARLQVLNVYAAGNRKGLTTYTSANETYVFGNGYWLYSSTTAAVGDLTDQLIAHVPENAGKKRTDLQSVVSATSEGIGDLRIGEPIPSSSNLVAWNPNACSTGVGAWTAKKPFAGRAGVGDFTLVTANGKRDGAIDTLMINSPAIPTKSGIRVGDSRQKVEKAFPKIEDADYTLKSSTGKIHFEIGSLDPNGPNDHIVIAIWVTTINGHLPVEGTDGNGPCPA